MSSSEKSSGVDGDKAEVTFHVSGQMEKQRDPRESDERQPAPARQSSWESAIKRIHNIIRVIALLSALGYFLYNHPDNYLSQRISTGVTSLREWRHHPYTLPEFYSICSRDGRGIYTSDSEAGWAQCVTVHNGTIVDVGDLGKSYTVL